MSVNNKNVLKSVLRLLLAFWIFVPTNCTTENVTIDTRIVGGTEADIRQVPYQVSLKYFDQHFCGGTLITPDTVITAAHCFGVSYPSFTYPFFTVKVGSNTTAGSSIAVKSVLIHPSYNNETIDSDICIVRLASNVTLNETVQLINVSTSDNYVAGSYATVSGWGYTQENGTVASLLRKVSVPLVDRTQCGRYYRSVINITKNMICAGFADGGKDACQGDSGGPLVQYNQLIGVVSFGMGCARAAYPGAYTNVARFTEWITKNSNYVSVNSLATSHSSPTVVILVLLLPLLFRFIVE
ncbi:trypsin alpha-3-like [Anthonomus grandis grandis]|uniref:trypsin alpha-3-like n=1 Tax=Anthonomus grandis grandis TaxID=2921223 RepID=UPI0021663F57|nr:trypsin alpha-3-like [Anthonomus grandis grandis]